MKKKVYKANTGRSFFENLRFLRDDDIKSYVKAKKYTFKAPKTFLSRNLRRATDDPYRYKRLSRDIGATAAGPEISRIAHEAANLAVHRALRLRPRVGRGAFIGPYRANVLKRIEGLKALTPRQLQSAASRKALQGGRVKYLARKKIGRNISRLYKHRKMMELLYKKQQPFVPPFADESYREGGLVEPGVFRVSQPQAAYSGNRIAAAHAGQQAEQLSVQREFLAQVVDDMRTPSGKRDLISDLESDSKFATTDPRAPTAAAAKFVNEMANF